MGKREFDGLTGVPLYTIKNCRYPMSCSYPYCSCRVPHDRYDQPRAAVKSWIWVWLMILLGCVFVLAGLTLVIWSVL